MYVYTPTTNFPKKVVSSDANAKLLSANDSTNFTFRGRFSSKEQALLVDSASSQKINSTFIIRWIAGRIISIHALRKESDVSTTHTLRHNWISIHALRKESDVKFSALM